MKSADRSVFLFLSVAIVAMCLASGFSAASDKQTLTGMVSDSMCGTQHMESDPVKCTRACIGHGAKYTLVVGDKVYSLNSDDKGVLTTLDQESGKKVTVTGVVNGVGVDVSSVAAAK
jgi:hypothetical protein